MANSCSVFWAFSSPDSYLYHLQSRQKYVVQNVLVSHCSVILVVSVDEQRCLVLLLSGLVEVTSSSWQVRALCSCKMSWQLTPIIFCLCSVYDTFDVVGTLIQNHSEKSSNTNKGIKFAKD